MGFESWQEARLLLQSSRIYKGERGGIFSRDEVGIKATENVKLKLKHALESMMEFWALR